MVTDCLLFIEHVSREMDVAVAVKYLLERHYGIRVQIASWHRLAEVGKSVRAKLILLPCCYKSTLHLHFWPECITFNLAWEQLFIRAFQREKGPVGVVPTKWVLHHAWGEFQRKFLASKGVPDSHILVNGHPAYQLYRPPYCDYFPSRQEMAQKFGLDPRKRWVFFPENYGWAFYSEFRIREMIQNGIPAEVATELQAYAKKAFLAAMSWCNQLAQTGQVEVIVKPRPAVAEDSFRKALDEAFQGSVNFRVLKQGSVREWVLASDVVISSYSTTLLEAAIANKAVFRVQPLPLPYHLSMDWLELIPCLESEEAFLENLLAPPPGPSEELRAWVEANVARPGDLILELCSLIARIWNGEIASPGKVPKDLYVEKVSWSRQVKDSIYRVIGSWTKRPGRFSLSERQMGEIDSYFDESLLKERMAAWTPVLEKVDFQSSSSRDFVQI